MATQPDALTQALHGLLVIAQDARTFEDRERLVAQWRKNYPEVVTMSALEQAANIAGLKAVEFILRDTQARKSRLSPQALSAINVCLGVVEKVYP